MAMAPRIEHSHCGCIVLSTKFLKLKVGNPVAPTHVLSQDPMRPSTSEPEKNQFSCDKGYRLSSLQVAYCKKKINA